MLKEGVHMNSRKYEIRLIFFTYLLIWVCFGNLAIIKQPYDKGALIIAIVMTVLIAYSHFVLRKFFPDGDKYIFIFANILAVIGIVMIYRISPINAVKQIMSYSLGVMVFILLVIFLPDLKKYCKYKYVYLVLTIIFMSMTYFCGVDAINGSKNWIKIGSVFMFQPSEFGKIFLVAYLSSVLKDYKNFKNLIGPSIVVMLSLGFMVLQKDLGSALIIFAISVTVLYIATSKFKYVFTCLLMFIVGSYFSYKFFAHVRVRFTIWRNPWSYATGKGMQIVQSLIGIAWGGFTGTGLGLGYPKFVPVNVSDFIFTSICEEMGILTGLGIIILYFLLFYRCMRAAIYVEDKFSRLLAVGYGTTIAAEALVIIGGVTNMIPLTGITLPFVSYGGSSMLITFFSLGIIQKISEGQY